jgi:hypothetical protein
VTDDWEPGHRRPERPIADEPPPPPGPSRPQRDDDTDPPDPTRIGWLIVGAAAIAAGTALGWDSAALTSIVTPPPLVRAALVGASVAIGIVLLLGAVNRLAGESLDGDVSARPARPDIGSMIRGVRLVFLAVAAFAAASGWALGHPLPLVVALIIAGVDVLETSFLLIVVGLRPRR